MADNDLEARARGYVDTFNAQKGIRWKDISQHFAGGGDSDSLARWISDKYNLPMDEAKKYALANSVLFDQRTDAGGRRLSQNENVAKMLGDLTPPGDPNAQGPNPDDIERERISKWLSDFTSEMSRDLGPGDPMFDSLSKLGAARASMGVGASGIRVGRGGLGEAAIQQGAMNSVMPYQMQRKQMAQQGLGMLDARDRGLEQLRQGADGLRLQATQMNNQMALGQYEQGKDSAGGWGGLAGGLVGGLAGGILTAATGGAAAPAIPGLISGGSAVGASLGQNTVARPQQQSYRPYGSFGGRGGVGY